MKILHTMLRVGDMQRSVSFYTGVLGMKLLRTTDRPEQKYSLSFVGYDTEERAAAASACAKDSGWWCFRRARASLPASGAPTSRAAHGSLHRAACRWSRSPTMQAFSGRAMRL